MPVSTLGIIAGIFFFHGLSNGHYEKVAAASKHLFFLLV